MLYYFDFLLLSRPYKSPVNLIYLFICLIKYKENFWNGQEQPLATTFNSVALWQQIKGLFLKCAGLYMKKLFSCLPLQKKKLKLWGPIPFKDVTKVFLVAFIFSPIIKRLAARLGCFIYVEIAEHKKISMNTFHLHAFSRVTVNDKT